MHVYIVDDERDLLTSLSIALRRVGHEPQGFSNPEAFLSVAMDLPDGCVILDYNMPGLNGLEVQAALSEMGAPHAIILLTGVGEVPEAVTAIRAGAVDFLKKPYRSADLFSALDRAAEAVERTQVERKDAERFDVLKTLTGREREILEALSHGLQNKQVAYDLGISVRTVEMHRGRVMKKLRTTTIGGAIAFAKEGKLL